MTDDQKTVEELEKEVNDLEIKKNDEEKRMRQLINKLDRKAVELKDDMQAEELKLREKDQEVKLKDMRLREVKRSQIVLQSKTSLINEKQ